MRSEGGCGSGEGGVVVVKEWRSCCCCRATYREKQIRKQSGGTEELRHKHKEEGI